MILVIPTVLGGLWQLLSLASIDISFVRFFSVAQMLPDGLVFLYIMLVLYCTFSVININSRNESNNHRSKLFFLKYFFTSAFLFIAFHFLMPSLLGRRISIFQGILWVSLPSAFLGILIYTVKESHFDLFRSEVFNKRFHAVLIYLFCGALFGAFIARIGQEFHKNFSLPLEVLSINVSKNGQVVYFNDQYIFLEVTQPDSTTKIEVLKFDAFFENQNTSLQTNRTEIDSLNNIIQLKDDEIDSLKSNLLHLQSKK